MCRDEPSAKAPFLHDGGRVINEAAKLQPVARRNPHGQSSAQAEVAAVNKTLASVGKIFDAGNDICFLGSRNKAFVYCPDQDEYIPMRKERGVFVFDLWVPPATGATTGASIEPGFSRQGR